LVNAGHFRQALALSFGLTAIFHGAPAVAGPPYVTDDPVPTDYRSWEIYTGFQYQNAGDGSITASVPFAEFNYGAMPNVQVSLALPIEDDTGTFQHYGYGVTEFGIKTRFVQESADRPQISFYPSIQIPSTPGHIVTFLPLWLQKSWGPWTAFGGGGVYLNPGAGERNYAFVGGTLERSISPATTIGAELYHQGADSTRAGDMTAANVGVTSQIGEYHAILFSFGRALHGSNTFSGYASYEFQLGPAKPK
jgi:hypothetical protein